MVTRRLIGAAARRPRLPSPAVERRLGRDNRYAQPLHLALRRVKADRPRRSHPEPPGLDSRHFVCLVA
jgi:hypothetical protein